MNGFKQIFCARNGQMSSKRVFGSLGIASSIVMSWYAIVNGLQTPDICDPILYTSCALLGVDSVMNVGGRRNDCIDQEGV